jgi:glycosyltransferase involved in cell wall biosynthesis
MKIVYFYQYFGTPKGGWSTRVYELAKRWIAAGHKVTVVTSLYDKSDLTAKGLVSRQIIEGIEVLIINVKISNKHSFVYRVYTFFMFALLSTYFALKLKYDVAIASSGPITIGLPGLVARKIRKKPMIFEVRDLWPEGAIQLGLLKSVTSQKLAYWFEEQCYKAASAIVALSEGMACSIKERYRLDNIYVIPNASDNHLFQNIHYINEIPSWAKDKTIFVYAGSLGLMDNCLQIVNAAAVLKKELRNNVVIVFIGEGAEKRDLEEYVIKEKLEHVKFLGLKPKEEVVSWLKNANAAFLVFKNVPVLNTSSPNKMFDAFAAGLPIIQTTQGWIKTLINNYNCGITVDPDSPQQMADAIELMTSNKSLRDEKAGNAKKVAKDLFDRDKLAAEMLKIILYAAEDK